MTEAERKSSTKLRSEAEKKLACLDGLTCGTNAEEVQKLVQELQVHQIELEMQNAQLAKSQAELEKSRTKYSDLFDFAPVGYLSFDKNGLILEANLAIATLLGAERRRMICNPFQNYIVVADRDIFRLHLQKVSSTRARDKCEVKLRAGNGHELYARLDSLYVEEPEGKISYRTAVTDITERKMAEEALQKSHDELEKRVLERTAELQRSNQALQEFASIASHDMQEPLRKISAFGNLLKVSCGESLGEQGADYLERMLNAASRMEVLLRALLDYSRAGVRKEPFSSVDLTRVVHEVVSDLEVRIAKEDGRVEVSGLPTVEADPHQMRQLFQNLIANGLKFHPADKPPVVRISGQRTDNGRYQILVEDNGIGFDENSIDRIFAPFQRLHGHNSNYEGTGMGLAICRKIVERHNGSITARSIPGTGSTFIVSLPIAQNKGSANSGPE